MCVCCGESEMAFLSIDHIDGGGCEHRRQIKSNRIYNWLINNRFPDGFQVLCFNCNFAKHVYGVCPHQTKRNGQVGR